MLLTEVKEGRYLVMASPKGNHGLMTGHVLDIVAGEVRPVVGKGNSREYIEPTAQLDFNGVEVVEYKDAE